MKKSILGFFPLLLVASLTVQFFLAETQKKDLDSNGQL